MGYDKEERDKRLKESLESEEAILEARRLTQQKARETARTDRQEAQEAAWEESTEEMLRNAKTLNDWCSRVLKESAAGYENFASVMNSVTPSVIMLADLTYDFNPIGRVVYELNNPGHIFNATLGTKFSSITDFLGDQLNVAWDATGNTLGDILAGGPKGAAPELQYFVDLNPNGTLAVHSLGGNLRRSDGAAITPKQQEFFEAGVAAWITTTNHQKYQLRKRPDSSYDVTERATGAKLKRDDFLKLRDDPVHGMKAFMNKRFDLVFEALDEKPAQHPAPKMGG